MNAPPASSNDKLLQQLFEQSPSFMAMLVGPEHRIALANTGYLKLVGHRAVLGRTVREALPEAIGQGYLDILDRAFATGEAYAATGALFVEENENGQATDHWVDFVYQPVREADGQVTGIFVHGFDVTERRKLEERRDNLAHLRDLLSVPRNPSETGYAAAALLGKALKASRVGYGTIDDEADTLHVEKDWTADGVDSLAGVTHLRHDGSSIDDLKLGKVISIDDVRLDPRTSSASRALEGKHVRSFVNYPVLENGRLVAVLFVNCAEARRWTTAELDLIDEVGSRTRTAMGRATAEAFLRDSEEQLRMATEAADIGLWDLDMVSGKLFWPPRMKAMFGISADVPVSMTDFYQGLHADDRESTTAAFAAAVDPQLRALYDVEYRTVAKDDNVIRWVAAKGRGVFDEQGRCLRVIGTAIDISARKASEAALKRSEEQLRESAKRKDQFIATLAHELRNPLAPLTNVIQLLNPGPEQVKLRDIMRRQVGHLVRLVDDLLEISRISGGVLELRLAPVDMEQVISHAVEASTPLIRERGHTLDLHLTSKPTWVMADAIRLAQILTNLLNNAARYTEPGGCITVKADHDGEGCVVAVSDTGQGFTPEQGRRIFEMFYRGKDSTGLGIGLALACKLAQMHGGRLEASSPGPGLGATFSVHLPCVEPPAENAEASNKMPAIPPRRVLVIDDNSDAADTLALLLEQFGMNVEVAHDGFAGAVAFARFAPAVVFLDIGMPGMDGYEVARKLRSDFREHTAQIVGLSGWGQPEDIRKGREAGFHHHLVKPVDPHELMLLLASLPGPAVKVS
ncbi:MAG: response regulator [Oxalobacteraceae bacterium]|nr:MAG: response regulator [Oxalobacteraceae bacterium]